MQDTRVRSNSGQLFPCKTCGKKFLTYSNLKLHERIHSLVKLKPFQCNLCGKTYSHKCTLLAHQLTHQQIYVCNICKKGFPKPKEYDEHCLKCHEDEETVIYCQQCNSEFRTGVCLALHRITCNRTRDIVPKLINQNAPVTPPKSESGTTRPGSTSSESGIEGSSVKKRRLSLDQEKIEKTKEKRSEFYDSDSSVDRQAKRREPLRACPFCKTIYKSAKGYKAHLRTHEGNPTNSCRYCPAKFHTIQSLRYHLQHFHGIRTEVPNPASSSSSSGHSQHSMFENQVVPRVNRIGNPQSHIEVKRIYVRQSLNEDPHVWPKVLMSRHLNDFINATYM